MQRCQFFDQLNLYTTRKIRTICSFHPRLSGYYFHYFNLHIIFIQEISRSDKISKHEKQIIIDFSIKAYERCFKVKNTDNVLKYLIKFGNNY